MQGSSGPELSVATSRSLKPLLLLTFTTVPRGFTELATVSYPHLRAQCGTIASVEPIAKERDRLLQRSARIIGLGSTIVALICFSVPGVLPWTSYLATLPLFALLFFCLFRIGMDKSLLWVLLGFLSGFAVLVVSLVPNGARDDGSLASAMVPLAAGLASFAIVLTTTIARRIVLLIGAAASLVLVEIAAPGTLGISEQGATVLVS
jgi:hypothetical protein